MAERVAKSTRWAVEEWAEIERAAGGMAPTTWVREAALGVARGAFPAAPEGRGSGGGGGVVRVGGRGVSPSGSASSRPASDWDGWEVDDLCDHNVPGRSRSRSPYGGVVTGLVWDGDLPYVAVRWPDGVEEQLLSEYLAPADPPVESAGSVVPVPPAGVAAPAVFPPLAAGAPELDGPAAPGMALQRAVELALMRRGVAPSVAKLQALKAIRGGKVVIDGEVCTDPAALVDPRDLG